ncbi:hypothetical protein LX36DRAFT_677850 [Colletotrichum falcatum]|nr:hypothetical protein LX36DRAFT_677850 [Colletotrichum falcatum]
MSCLNLTSLLESGSFSDFHLICIDSDGVEKKFSVHKNIVFTQCAKIKDLATVAPIRKGSDGIEFAHLEYDPVSFGARDLHDVPQPLFYPLCALKLAHELEIFVMYEEAASALCCSAEYYTHRVDFPGMVDELYSTCGQHAQFDMYFSGIAEINPENSLVDRRFQDRLRPTMLKHPQLALGVTEATLEALAETRRDFVQAQEEISDMRARGFRSDEFWAQAETERQKDREMRQKTAERFGYRNTVCGSLKRSPSS